MEEVKQLIADIRGGTIKPIYFLMGEEPYFIDRISEYIADHILNEEEKGFNQTVVYGKDVSLQDVVATARRYPMMAERQVVIVKEAQHLSRSIEDLSSYAENPQLSTVLVICFKYKKLDKRKKLHKALRDHAVVFESRKLYENQVAEWIRGFLRTRGSAIAPKAAQLLVEHLGTDLSRIHNELDKLLLILPEGSEIGPGDIEQHIGISKDYNNFELKKAIGEGDRKRAARIIRYFSENPKENPFVVTITLLHSFFSQLLQYHGLSDHSPRSVASALHINPYFVSEYQTAARNYPMKRVSHIISYLRDLDLKGKGVGSVNLSHSDLLKELLVKIM